MTSVSLRTGRLTQLSSTANIAEKIKTMISSDGLKVKMLPPNVIKEIQQKNLARKLAGLSLITIKHRRCIICGSIFESTGNRACGCSTRTAGSISGREII